MDSQVWKWQVKELWWSVAGHVIAQEAVCFAWAATVPDHTSGAIYLDDCCQPLAVTPFLSCDRILCLLNIVLFPVL